MIIRVANWKHYQKIPGDRVSQPWLKMHRKLRDKRSWRELPPAAAKLLMDLWMTADHSTGEINVENAELAWALRIDVEALIQLSTILKAAGFIELRTNGATMDPEWNQDGSLEREREREL